MTRRERRNKTSLSLDESHRDITVLLETEIVVLVVANISRHPKKIEVSWSLTLKSVVEPRCGLGGEGVASDWREDASIGIWKA